MGGIAALVPLAITTARRATSGSPPTCTVPRSVNLPSPRKSRAPVASIAAVGRLSSRLRAIQSTRLETLGKSTVHSTREAARTRARSASVKVSLERSRVFEGTQPQYGHSPPTSSRSTTARVSELSRRPTAIASPATPPPRQTTSNSWGTSLPPSNVEEKRFAIRPHDKRHGCQVMRDSRFVMLAAIRRVSIITVPTSWWPRSACAVGMSWLAVELYPPFPLSGKILWARTCSLKGQQLPGGLSAARKNHLSGDLLRDVCEI